MAVQFFSEQTDMPDFDKKTHKLWIEKVIALHGKKSGSINYIFTTDSFLLDINKTYLQHDYLTDIITFNFSDARTLHGDIYISTERVRENAAALGTSANELQRVMIHGILHLLGFDDNNDENKATMRRAEDECLGML